MARSIELSITEIGEYDKPIPTDGGTWEVEVKVDGINNNNSFTVSKSCDTWFSYSIERKQRRTTLSDFQDNKVKYRKNSLINTATYKTLSDEHKEKNVSYETYVCLKIVIQKNLSTSPRCGRITVQHNNANISKSIEIYQQALEYQIEIDPESNKPDSQKHFYRFNKMPRKNDDIYQNYEEQQFEIKATGGRGLWYVKEVKQYQVTKNDTFNEDGYSGTQNDGDEKIYQIRTAYDNTFNYRIEGNKLIIRSYGQTNINEDTSHMRYFFVLQHSDVNNANKISLDEIEDYQNYTKKYQDKILCVFGGEDGYGYGEETMPSTHGDVSSQDAKNYIFTIGGGKSATQNISAQENEFKLDIVSTCNGLFVDYKYDIEDWIKVSKYVVINPFTVTYQDGDSLTVDIYETLSDTNKKNCKKQGDAYVVTTTFDVQHNVDEIIIIALYNTLTDDDKGKCKPSHFTTLQNTDFADRLTTVTFTQDDSGKTVTLNISQTGASKAYKLKAVIFEPYENPSTSTYPQEYYKVITEFKVDDTTYVVGELITIEEFKQLSDENQKKCEYVENTNKYNTFTLTLPMYIAEVIETFTIGEIAYNVGDLISQTVYDDLSEENKNKCEKIDTVTFEMDVESTYGGKTTPYSIICGDYSWLSYTNKTDEKGASIADSYVFTVNTNTSQEMRTASLQIKQTNSQKVLYMNLYQGVTAFDVYFTSDDSMKSTDKTIDYLEQEVDIEVVSIYECVYIDYAYKIEYLNDSQEWVTDENGWLAYDKDLSMAKAKSYENSVERPNKNADDSTTARIIFTRIPYYGVITSFGMHSVGEKLQPSEYEALTDYQVTTEFKIEQKIYAVGTILTAEEYNNLTKELKENCKSVKENCTPQIETKELTLTQQKQEMEVHFECSDDLTFSYVGKYYDAPIATVYSYAVVGGVQSPLAITTATVPDDSFIVENGIKYSEPKQDADGRYYYEVSLELQENTTDEARNSYITFTNEKNKTCQLNVEQRKKGEILLEPFDNIVFNYNWTDTQYIDDTGPIPDIKVVTQERFTCYMFFDTISIGDMYHQTAYCFGENLTNYTISAKDGIVYGESAFYNSTSEWDDLDRINTQIAYLSKLQKNGYLQKLDGKYLTIQLYGSIMTNPLLPDPPYKVNLTIHTYLGGAMIRNSAQETMTNQGGDEVNKNAVKNLSYEMVKTIPNNVSTEYNYDNVIKKCQHLGTILYNVKDNSAIFTPIQS